MPKSNRAAKVNGAVVLCGGSNGTAFFSGLWSSGRLPVGALDVRVVTRRPERFAEPLTCRETHATGEGFMLADSVFAPKRMVEFKSGKVGAFDYEHIDEALEGAGCVWICAPVNAYGDILNRIMPAVTREAERAGRTDSDPILVSIMYAQGGVDWQAIQAAGGRLPPGVGLCLLKNFPCLVSRVSESVVENYGYHPNCGWFAPVPKSAGPAAERTVRALFGCAVSERSWTVQEVASPVLCTLGGSNQLLHPTIIGGLLGPPPGRNFEEQPKVYRNLPWRTFQLMRAVWKEYCFLTLHLEKVLKTQEGKRFELIGQLGFVGPVRALISLSGYNWPDFSVECLSWIAINGTSRLHAAKMPLIVDPNLDEAELQRLQKAGEPVPKVLNNEHRFIVDDVPFGLCVALGIGEIVGCPMPEVASLIAELQQYLHKEYVVVKGARYVLQGKDVASSGAPQAYGVTTVQQLQELIVSGHLPGCAGTPSRL